MTRLERFLAAWLLQLLLLLTVRWFFVPDMSWQRITFYVIFSAFVAYQLAGRKERDAKKEDRESSVSSEYRDPKDILNRQSIRKWKERK